MRFGVLAAILAGVLIAAPGLGFAAFHANAAIGVRSTPGSVGLVVTRIAIVTGPDGTVVGYTPLPSPTVEAWINNTAPGGTVNLTVVIENIGTVPAVNVTFVLSTSVQGPSGCTIGTYMYPAEANVPPGQVLAPGASFPSYWIFQAGPNLSACAGEAFFSFTITYVAVA